MKLKFTALIFVSLIFISACSFQESVEDKFKRISSEYISCNEEFFNSDQGFAEYLGYKDKESCEKIKQAKWEAATDRCYEEYSTPTAKNPTSLPLDTELWYGKQCVLNWIEKEGYTNGFHLVLFRTEKENQNKSAK